MTRPLTTTDHTHEGAEHPVFVIVEWNQASHQPSIAVDAVYGTAAEAQGFAQELRDALGQIGRGERYTVHELGEELSTR